MLIWEYYCCPRYSPVPLKVTTLVKLGEPDNPRYCEVGVLACSVYTLHIIPSTSIETKGRYSCSSVLHNYNLNGKPNETEEFHIKVFSCKYLAEHCTVELQDKGLEMGTSVRLRRNDIARD